MTGKRATRTKAPALDKRPAPSDAEKKANRSAIDRLREQPSPVAIRWEPSKAKICSPHTDELGNVARLMETLGTRSHDSFSVGLGSLEVVSRPRHTERGQTESHLNASLALVAAIAPRDELEGAIALQMAGCHALAVEMMGKAKQTDNLAHLQAYGILAVKLQRTFTSQVEALAKLRGGGKQQVEVRHVYVNGNAVIGDVHATGGGAAAENRDQPHTQSLEYLPGEPVPSMRSADAGREPLPVALGEGAETVSDARGDFARGS